MKKLIVLCLLLYGVFVLQISAQTLLINDKIPDDLLITVKRQSGWGRNFIETTINANGEFSFQNSQSFPVAKLSTEVYILGKPIKNPRYLKPKLPLEKLKQLITEFEKIQFFRFGKDFPAEETRVQCVSDAATEIISIRLNGQTKEVSNDLGCSGKRAHLLRDLAERIRGAGIWNYENGEVPQVLEILYRVNDSTRIERDFRISGEGKIVERLFWRLDSKTGQKLYAQYPLKTKTVGKLSKAQIKKLMDEFEKAIFSTFKYSILTKHAGCQNEAGLNEHKRTQIQVQINHIAQMYGTLYKDCNPLPDSDAAKFEYMIEVLTKMLNDVGVI